jgi:hypothetical protein
MGTAQSSLRDVALADVLESAERTPRWGKSLEADGGVQVVTDYYLTWDMAQAVKAIYKGRWRLPATRLAIDNAREALKALGYAMQAEMHDNRRRNRR